MNRQELTEYIESNYAAHEERLWTENPENGIFRHAGNRKWFALLMRVSKDKFISGCEGACDVLNVKCEPAMIGSLINEDGIFPAYHMNKTHWISVLLDGSADDERIKLLVDISFGLTAPKKKKISPKSKKA